MPIDALHASSWDTGLETLAVHPTPAAQDPGQASTIGAQRFDKTSVLSGLPRLLHPLNRFAFKLVEALGKKYFFWSTWWRDRRYAARFAGAPAATHLKAPPAD